MIVDSITLPDGRKLKASKPLEFIPVFYDDEYFIENDDWGIYVFASSIEDLRKELEEQIGVLWLAYVDEGEAALSEPCLPLRERLRSALTDC